MSKFIALEGLHGVGKSTVASLVASHFGVVLTPTIPKEFGEIRSYVNRQTSLEARYMLFLSAVLSAGEEIKRKIESGSIVVTESYIFRTIAFHEGMGSSISVEIGKELYLPTHTVLLTCAQDVRNRRLKNRGGVRGVWDVQAEEKTVDIERRYQQFGLPTIDTTDLTPEEVANKVVEIVNVHI